MYRSLFPLLLLFIGMPLSAEKAQLWQIAKQPLFQIKTVQFSFRQAYYLDMADFRTESARFSLDSRKALCKFLDGEIHYT